jgi:hypothetical protein
MPQDPLFQGFKEEGHYRNRKEGPYIGVIIFAWLGNEHNLGLTPGQWGVTSLNTEIVSMKQLKARKVYNLCKTQKWLYLLNRER